MSFLPVLSFSLLISSPFSSPASAQKIETVEGVRVVHNNKGGERKTHPRISIELIRTIGDVDTTDENLAFDNPGDMAVDDLGSIFILDSGNCRVQKFSPEGEYMATIGREGQGPGEFSGPRSIDLDAKGFLYVLDVNQKRIQVFTPEGKEHKILPTIKCNLDRLRVLACGPFVAGSYTSFGGPGEPKKKIQPKLVKRLDPDCNLLPEFGERFDFGDKMTNAVGNSCHFALDGQDQIYLSFAYQNRVERYSPEGRLVWRADRELNYSTKVIERGKQEVTKTSAKFTAPKMNRVSGGIAVDDRGRAWVVTYNRQIKREEEVTTVVSGSVGGGTTRKIVGNTDLQTTDMYKLEIFAPDGVLLGVIPLTQFVDMIHVWKDRVFLLDRDRGVKFYQYRISEN